MNDWLGCYGCEQAITPNIDTLASQGVLFEKAYCAAAVCNASRVSVLTGKHPCSTGIYLDQPLLYCHPELVTIPAYFKQNGYTVHGGGKLFHQTPGHLDVQAFDSYYEWVDNPQSRAWGMDYVQNYAELFGIDKHIMAFSKTAIQGNNNHFDFHAFDDKLEPRMADSMVTTWAVDFLAQEHNRPFFLAVGLYSPHKPNYAPRQYYDQYPLDKIVTPVVPDDDLDDLPNRSKNLQQNRAKGLTALIKDCHETAEFVRGYLASVTYADAQVGRLLQALENSPYHDNTIIVLWTDNGYHLGEKMHWGKYTLWERATHVPLIIAGGPANPGHRCKTPVSLIDLYPTLIDLCGLPPMQALDGESLVDCLEQPAPDRERYIISAWQFPYGKQNVRPCISVRSRDWRYIYYPRGNHELYNEVDDPNEWHNLADCPEYIDIIKQLRQHLPKNMQTPGPHISELELIIENDRFYWTPTTTDEVESAE